MLSRLSLRQTALRLDDRATLIAFRLLIFLLLTFFLLYSEAQEAAPQFRPFALLAAYLLSNLVLWELPDQALGSPLTQAAVVLFDIGVVSAAIYASQGWDGDLYLVYFLVVFMSSLDASLARSFLTATVACAVYVGLSLRSQADWGSTPFLLRIPFFYLVSFFGAYLAAQARSKSDKLEKDYRGRLDLAERRSAVGRLAREIATELGSPIEVLEGLSQSLLRATALGDAKREPAEAILREAARCKTLLRRFLLLTTEAVTPFGLVELNAAVREAVQTVREAKAWPPRLELTLDLSHELPVVRGERSQLVTALANIIQNAVDAMPRGGTLTVRTRCETHPDGTRQARIDVVDTGDGIPEFARDRIFEPFFTTKRRLKRVGLGLCFVSAIVDRHRGRLEFDSVPRRGTRFTVSLSEAR